MSWLRLFDNHESRRCKRDHIHRPTTVDDHRTGLIVKLGSNIKVLPDTLQVDRTVVCTCTIWATKERRQEGSEIGSAVTRVNGHRRTNRSTCISNALIDSLEPQRIDKWS